MDMLAMARENRIKALKTLERKRTLAKSAERPQNFITSQIIQFRSTRFDTASPLMLG